MKVAIVTPFGGEDRLDSFAEFILAKGLVTKGYSVRFYTYRMRSIPSYVKDGLYKGIAVFRCPQFLGLSWRLVWNIFWFRPDVVILCHIRSWLNLSALMAARLVGAKVIFQVIGFLHDPCVVKDRDNPLETIRTDIHLFYRIRDLLWGCVSRQPGCWENFVTHAPLYRADERVTITSFEREKLQELAGLDSVIVPWGVSLTPSQVEKIPEFPGRPFPESFLFFIGQVKRRKGWDTILEALAQLKERGIRKNLVFATASSPEDRQEAIDLAKRLGIDDRIWFLFTISNEEKVWLYHRAAATLAPSRYEGFGLTVFESWTYGKPVLGTDIPVYSDFLLDGDTGLVSKKGDPTTLAENMLRLDDTALYQMLVAGGSRMVRNYSDTRIVELFEQIIRKFTGPQAS